MPLAMERAGGKHAPGSPSSAPHPTSRRAARAAAPRRRRAADRWRYTPERASRHTRQTAAKPYGLPVTGEMTRLMACACVGQKGGWPPAGDLLVQQVALDQRRPELGLQPLALQLLARGGTGRQGRFTGGQEGVVPAGQRRRRDAQLARDGLQVFPAQQPQHRRALALA
jgi:hypothetical protein